MGEIENWPKLKHHQGQQSDDATLNSSGQIYMQASLSKYSDYRAI
jgi:hypothetical protein